MTPKIRILYLEDRPEDVELVKDILERQFPSCEVVWVSGREGFLSALTESWSYDLILADFFLPTIGGEEALALARAQAAHLPFVFLSGSLGEERAVECLRRGATDYVFKSNLARLIPVLRRALEEAGQAKARRDAEAANAKVAALLRATLESTAEGLLVVDLAGRVSVYNRKFLALFGIPEYVMANMDLEAVIQYLTNQFESPVALLEELRLLRSRPEKETLGVLSLSRGKSLEHSGRPQRVGSETVGRVLSVREAPGERADPLQIGFLEGLKGLREAILAGRVAPWFLASDRLIIPDFGLAILGTAALPRTLPELVALIHPEDINALMEALERAQNVSFKLRMRRRDGSWIWFRWNLERCPDGYRGVFLDINEQERLENRIGERLRLDGARDAATRLAQGLLDLLEPALAEPHPGALGRSLEAAGEALVQLKGYAQLGHPDPVPVQPNAFLQDVLAGADPSIEFMPGAGLPAVALDPALMSRALGELLRNARQSGADRIQVSSGLQPPRPYRPGGLPGPQKSRVWFEVREHGPGIPEDQREPDFEPFASGGLGLVGAIVDGHGGSIRVESSPEMGTAVRILLPV